MINCSKTYDAFSAGQDLLRFESFGRRAFEPVHFSVAFCCQPILKLVHAGWRSGVGETAIIETQFQRATSNGFLHAQSLFRWAELAARGDARSTGVSKRAGVFFMTGRIGRT